MTNKDGPTLGAQDDLAVRLSDDRRAEIESVAREFCGHLSEDEFREAVVKIANVVRPR